MNEAWKSIFKNYIDDFHAIIMLYTHNIVDKEEKNKLKSKLLSEIISTFESELNN